MPTNSPVDFLIVSPLGEERDAVLDRLPGQRKLPPAEGTVRVYYEAQLPVTFSDGASSCYRVVVLPLAKMGHTEAATATMEAVKDWNPRYVLLVGIAGGVARNQVNLGDVLVSNQIVDYELQKVGPNHTEYRWQAHQVDQRLLIAAQNFSSTSWHATSAKRPRSAAKLQVHLGPICTGNKVIADEGLLNELRAVWEKLIGVEMEAGGVANAALQAASRPGFFMIRGVSDLADPAKDSKKIGDWRPYAREIAAAYAIEFLKSGPVPASVRTEWTKSRRAIQRSPRPTRRAICC